MKNKITTLAAGVLILLISIGHSHAATQVYDLKADWSDTQNPNATWSYRCPTGLGDLMINDLFPWAAVNYAEWASIKRITGPEVITGVLETGDICANVQADLPVVVRWTAPAAGSVSLAGHTWEGNLIEDGGTISGIFVEVALNGGQVATGAAGLGAPRNLPLALPSLEIPVQVGDQIDLNLWAPGTIGLNYTITFATDSIDPIAAIESLAIAVFEMNLQNGIENNLDSKLDAALATLEDANVSNDGAACNSLSAFVSAVEAQRGKKISNAQADDLVAAAKAIQTSLTCGN